MIRIDRYVLRQLLGPFAFFVLVFTGVIWLSQSLRVIDAVVNNGQSAIVFLEFTVLLLPTVMAVVLPVSALAATLYALNRMTSDSEIVVLQGAGMSLAAMLRPVALFGGGVMVLLFLNTLYAMPTAKRALHDRLFEVRGDLAAAFLQEGTFVTPSKGVTVYLRAMGRPGEMLGVFVHDERDPDRPVTYTAERAVLFQDADPPLLVMFDGVAQSVAGAEGGTLQLLRFERFSYDLSQFARATGARRPKPSEFYVDRLLTIGEDEIWRNRTLGEYRAEGHEMLSAPLYALALPLVAAGFVLGSGFRRGGIGARIGVAVGAALGLRLLGLAAKGATGSEAALWPLMYAPPALALALAFVLLAPPRRRGAAGAPEEVAR